MSHNDSILNILGIKDKNIKIISVEEAEHNDDSVKEYITLITATLSYPINRCRNCGFPTVNKDGFRKTHVRLASLNGRRYELELRKQRYKCKSCHTTFGAITNLTKENQTLSSNLKNQIMLLARKGLSGQLIAEMCHPSSGRECRQQYWRTVCQGYLIHSRYCHAKSASTFSMPSPTSKRMKPVTSALCSFSS